MELNLSIKHLYCISTKHLYFLYIDYEARL